MYPAYQPAQMRPACLKDSKVDSVAGPRGNGGVMDDETESGMGLAGDGRSLGFILSASTRGL